MMSLVGVGGGTSPFRHAGQLDLVDDDDLLAPVDRGGEADAQAGGGALHDLHQQGARGLLHSLWGGEDAEGEGMDLGAPEHF